MCFLDSGFVAFYAQKFILYLCCIASNVKLCLASMFNAFFWMESGITLTGIKINQVVS